MISWLRCSLRCVVTLRFPVTLLFTRSLWTFVAVRLRWLVVALRAFTFTGCAFTAWFFATFTRCSRLVRSVPRLLGYYVDLILAAFYVVVDSPPLPCVYRVVILLYVAVDCHIGLFTVCPCPYVLAYTRSQFLPFVAVDSRFLFTRCYTRWLIPLLPRLISYYVPACTRSLLHCTFLPVRYVWLFPRSRLRALFCVRSPAAFYVYYAGLLLLRLPSHHYRSYRTHPSSSTTVLLPRPHLFYSLVTALLPALPVPTFGLLQLPAVRYHVILIVAVLTHFPIIYVCYPFG